MMNVDPAIETMYFKYAYHIDNVQLNIQIILPDYMVLYFRRQVVFIIITTRTYSVTSFIYIYNLFPNVEVG
jgi:hypothetical protein